MAHFIYTRVSTLDQAESGAGLAAQRDSCRRWAAAAGVDISAIYEDAGISGAKGLEARPGLLDAVTAMGKGDVLLVAKRDRLGRDPIAVAMIEAAVGRKGGRIVSAAGEGTESNDPASVLMRRMVDAFSEYERLLIGARTKAALQAKRKRSERTGSIPYGKALAKDGVHLIDHPEEQDVICKAREYHAAGLSLRGIAARLASQNLYARNGRQFAAEQIRSMVRVQEAA